MTGVLLGFSFFVDRAKTRRALRKALGAFLNILPNLAVVFALVGLVLAFLSPNAISGLIGGRSGWLGMLVASIVGSVTLIPAFVAFPLAASLLAKGAGLAQIGVLASTLMMVGIVTMPLEIKYFGRRETFWRNGLAYLFSFVVGLVIKAVLG
jgi:uncharacterized membrane protein YraQ (UPF0718 family)